MCALLTWYIYFTRYITLSPSFTTILFGKLFKLVTPEHLGHNSDSYVRFHYAKVWHLGVTWKLIHNTVKCFDQLNVSTYLRNMCRGSEKKLHLSVIFAFYFFFCFPWLTEVSWHITGCVIAVILCGYGQFTQDIFTGYLLSY